MFMGVDKHELGKHVMYQSEYMLSLNMCLKLCKVCLTLHHESMPETVQSMAETVTCARKCDPSLKLECSCFLLVAPLVGA